MEFTVFVELVASAVVFTALTVFLGYLIQRWMGVFILGVSASLASTACIAGVIVGYIFRGDTGAWIGLAGGIVLAVILVAVFIRLLTLFTGIYISKGTGRFAILLWFGLCGLAIFGHLAGGWVGLLILILPAFFLFWFGLYHISGHILPLRDKGQRNKAFRSLITFNMGTNYPFYFVDENGQPEKRVDGDPFLQLFAGPGIVYTDCEHAAYVSDSMFKNRVFEPGLNFTDLFDLPPRIIDLRPQLRAFQVDALTKDDISIKVVTFIPFKIDTDNQTVERGQSFPTNHKAVQAAVTGDLIENKGDKADDEKHEWDGQLVRLIATPIVQDIISQYTIDQLCAPDNIRAEIAKQIVERVTKALQPYGLKVIGGGISNLVPQDEIVVEKRLDNWRTEWERKILERIDPAKYEYILELEQAKTAADLVKHLAKVAKESKEEDALRLLHLVDPEGEYRRLSDKH